MAAYEELIILQINPKRNQNFFTFQQYKKYHLISIDFYFKILSRTFLFNHIIMKGDFFMSICLPDYNNCTVNLACSILKEFGAERPEHPTLPAADRLLSKKHYTNIVVLFLMQTDSSAAISSPPTAPFSHPPRPPPLHPSTARSARRNTAGSAGTVIFPRSGAPLPYY